MALDPTSGAPPRVRAPVFGALHLPGMLVPSTASLSLQTYGSRCHTCPWRPNVEPRDVPYGLVIRIRVGCPATALSTGVAGSCPAVSVLLNASDAFGIDP